MEIKFNEIIYLTHRMLSSPDGGEKEGVNDDMTAVTREKFWQNMQEVLMNVQVVDTSFLRAQESFIYFTLFIDKNRDNKNLVES